MSNDPRYHVRDRNIWSRTERVMITVSVAAAVIVSVVALIVQATS